jgi:phosphate transport system ATP-binding protein
MRVEELMLELKENYTIVIVTHNLHQAARISDECGFFYLGQLVEYNRTSTLFTNPAEKRTEDYVTGRFGRSSHGSVIAMPPRRYRVTYVC